MRSAALPADPHPSATGSPPLAASLGELGASISSMTNAMSTIGADVEQQSSLNAELISRATATAEAIDALTGVAGDIELLVRQVRTIAATTDMLAINAAIEAARSGEAGKAFAVVANEVKALSASVSAANSDIASMLAQVQNRADFARRSLGDLHQGIVDVNLAAESIRSAVVGQRTLAQTVAMQLDDCLENLNDLVEPAPAGQ